jgi:hypothetical protein
MRDICTLDMDVKNRTDKFIIYNRLFPTEKRKEKETILFSCISVGRNVLKTNSFSSIFVRHFVRIYLSSYAVTIEC